MCALERPNMLLILTLIQYLQNRTVRTCLESVQLCLICSVQFTKTMPEQSQDDCVTRGPAAKTLQT